MANRALAAKAERSRAERREAARVEFSKSSYLTGKVATFGDDIPGCAQTWEQYHTINKRRAAPLHHADKFIATPAMLAAWITEAPRLIKKAR